MKVFILLAIIGVSCAAPQNFFGDSNNNRAHAGAYGTAIGSAPGAIINKRDTFGDSNNNEAEAGDGGTAIGSAPGATINKRSVFGSSNRNSAVAGDGGLAVGSAPGATITQGGSSQMLTQAKVPASEPQGSPPSGNVFGDSNGNSAVAGDNGIAVGSAAGSTIMRL